VPTGRRIDARNTTPVANDEPVAVIVACPTPGTTTTTLLAGQPPVSRYVTVNRITVAGVPVRGVASGALSWISCEAPLQLAA
jgi:hypothetical protein